jgi:HAD superfamily hydrolase (TIGR01509 family)
MRRGVLLDIDGTLIDSNEAHARAWVDALAETGRAVDFERVLGLIGQGGDKLVRELVHVPRFSAEGEALSSRRKELFLARYCPQVRALPGARALLARIRDAGMVTVVATSAEADELEALLAQGDFADLIDVRATSDDADRSKPDPDIIDAALRRAHLSPREAALVGDTPWDVEAARRASVPVVALRSGGWNDAALANAAAIYDDPADLVAHFAESPLAR